MTELQVGLIGLGIASVLGVVVYNTWQEYRQRKLLQQALNKRPADVLFDTPSFPLPEGEAPAGADFSADDAVHISEALCEPVLSAPLPSSRQIQASALSEEAGPGERIEPGLFAEKEREAQNALVVDEIPVRNGETRGVREEVETAHLLSPVIDYVASFESVDPVSVRQFFASVREALARIRKPIHWIGYNEHCREWEALVDDGKSEYRRIRVGVQLVDRQGALAECELTVFHTAMQDLADETMAIVDLPPRQAALDAVLELDRFCASVDIQIGINVVSTAQVFPGTKLRALAEAAGMVIDADGRFVRCDDEGHVLYVLLNQESSGFSPEGMKTMSTHGLTFLLDVPRVTHGERVFNQMVDLARRFSEVLRGALVDDNRRPLSEAALEPIRRQVGQYQAMMAARHLPAGGALAQRLFS